MVNTILDEVFLHKKDENDDQKKDDVANDDQSGSKTDNSVKDVSNKADENAQASAEAEDIESDQLLDEDNKSNTDISVADSESITSSEDEEDEEMVIYRKIWKE